MPRKATKTATATPRSAVGPFIVANPHGAPPGRILIKYHVCDSSMKKERDAAKHVGICTEYRWFEGDTLEPPEGFGLERFLQHQPMPGRSCGDDSHENCAGPYLEEVSADG